MTIVMETEKNNIILLSFIFVTKIGRKISGVILVKIAVGISIHGSVKFFLEIEYQQQQSSANSINSGFAATDIA
jgi:hypothetical protein